MSPHRDRRRTHHDRQDWLAAEACRRATEAVFGDTAVKCAQRRHILSAATMTRSEPPAPPSGRHTA